MPAKKMTACALLFASLLTACASSAPVVQAPPILCPPPPAPAAWAMQPPSLMQRFESVFSISAPP